MIEIKVFKAQQATVEKIEDTIIEIKQEIGDHPTLEDAMETFKEQAEKIELALRNALPGGTYDQLLAAMLKRKASHFIVSYK